MKTIALALTLLAQEKLDVTNPASGAKLWVRVSAPKDASAQRKYPAVILVPGGIGFGSQMPPSLPDQVTSKGMVLVIFDPDGRGKSGGTEDYNGKIHQDGLLAVVRAAKKLEYLDRVGIVSLSYGIAMASGMLGRYPDEKVAFYIDWEGPSDRFWVTVWDRVFDHPGRITFGGHRTSDEEWWKEREAVRFAPLFRCPYLRIQSERDHVHKEKFGHALQMIASATGKAPWTRINDNPPDTVFTEEKPPKLLAPGRRNADLWIPYAMELFARK
ncbi:MAG: hypothetical protein HYY17_00795 [Planctomycetes bacterium]|nr:hypothetical protein [Planctomycetota bacterium]